MKANWRTNIVLQFDEKSALNLKNIDLTHA